MLYVGVSKVFSVALVAMSTMQEIHASPLGIEKIHKANAVIKVRSSEEDKILPRFLGAIAASLAPAILGSTVGPVLTSVGNSLSGKSDKPPAQDDTQGDQVVPDNTQGGQVVPDNTQGGQVGQGFAQGGQVGQGFAQGGQVGQGFAQPGQVGQGFAQPGQVGQGTTQNNAQNGQTKEDSESNTKNKNDSEDEKEEEESEEE